MFPFNVLITLLIVSDAILNSCDGAENGPGLTNKWTVSSQWSFNTQWKSGQTPTTQVKITQNASPGAPSNFLSQIDKSQLPNLDSLINQAIQTASQQLNTKIQQNNFQDQFLPGQMHTFTIQTPGNTVQTISVPLKPSNNQLPPVPQSLPPQSNWAPPKQNVPSQQQNIPTPQQNQPPPQTNVPQRNSSSQQPLRQPTNPQSNFQQRPTNQNFPQVQPNSLKTAEGSFVAEEADERPTWGQPIPNRLEQVNQPPVITTTLPPPVIQKSNTSSLTFIVRDREFEPSVPPAADYVKNSVSLRYCLSYCNIRFVQNGGEIAVVGGENARLNEFPHMVALGFTTQGWQGQTLVSWNSCGGSLISRNFVLTAAHCMFSDRGYPTQVRVGEHDLSTTEDGAQPQDLQIAQIIVHPDYNANVSEYNDIALIRLQGHVTFTKYMRPACLYTGLPSVEDSEKPWKPVATGWGLTGFTDAPSDILQKVNLDIIDQSTCKNLQRPNQYIPNGVNEETQLCAGVLAGGKDTCLGDSGGPLQVNNTVFHWLRECPMDIVGITSFGNQCANENSPSIYTRVKHFVPWIESIVWPGET